MTTAPPPQPQPARPLNDANRLGLDYRALAAAFAYDGPILDVHTHLADVHAARDFFAVADLFGIRKAWSMSPLEKIDEIAAEFGNRGDRIEFIAVPNYAASKDDPECFTTDWLRRIEAFREKGCRVIKFWAAPRGRDFHPEALLIDSPIRREGMKLAYDLGYRHFMTHVADPDTWFATVYSDAGRYGTKASHFPPLERSLEAYPDVTWIGAHMGGSPEDLDFLQGMLDRHPNYVVDCSATKWMVRELSKKPAELRAFCERNRGRVLFGSDIVAATDPANRPPEQRDRKDTADTLFDLYASRYWALRTLLETAYDGPSPIVDPDLHRVDPTAPEKSTAALRGAQLPPEVLRAIYHDNAARVFDVA